MKPKLPELETKFYFLTIANGSGFDVYGGTREFTLQECVERYPDRHINCEQILNLTLRKLRVSMSGTRAWERLGKLVVGLEETPVLICEV